jgi:hypothetical protein
MCAQAVLLTPARRRFSSAIETLLGPLLDALSKMDDTASSALEYAIAELVTSEGTSAETELAIVRFGRVIQGICNDNNLLMQRYLFTQD